MRIRPGTSDSTHMNQTSFIKLLHRLQSTAALPLTDACVKARPYEDIPMPKGNFFGAILFLL